MCVLEACFFFFFLHPRCNQRSLQLPKRPPPWGAKVPLDFLKKNARSAWSHPLLDRPAIEVVVFGCITATQNPTTSHGGRKCSPVHCTPTGLGARPCGGALVGPSQTQLVWVGPNQPPSLGSGIAVGRPQQRRTQKHGRKTGRRPPGLGRCGVPGRRGPEVAGLRQGRGPTGGTCVCGERPGGPGWWGVGVGSDVLAADLARKRLKLCGALGWVSFSRAVSANSWRSLQLRGPIPRWGGVQPTSSILTHR